MRNPFDSFDLASFNLIRQRIGLQPITGFSCPPPVVNSAAHVVVTPANDGQGVGTTNTPSSSRS
jgi:hypothetical protein